MGKNYLPKWLCTLIHPKSQDLSLIFHFTECVRELRYITIGAYQISLLLLIVCVVCPIVLSATYYLWTTKTIPLSVDEPLSIVDSPSSLHTHPGENQTLSITIENVAQVNYSVTLVFSLNNTAYQDAYVTFSNHTYNITPTTNQIIAWMSIDNKANSVFLELTVDFYRE